MVDCQRCVSMAQVSQTAQGISQEQLESRVMGGFIKGWGISLNLSVTLCHGQKNFEEKRTFDSRASREGLAVSHLDHLGSYLEIYGTTQDNCANSNREDFTGEQ